MSIKILYFGYIKDVFKKSFDIISLKDICFGSNNENTYETICDYILKLNDSNMNVEISKIGQKVDFKTYLFKICLLAQNDEFIDKKSIVSLNDNDIISIIPPVSGG